VTERKKALVLFSGGQDSATCLAWALARDEYEHVETIGFSYGQRHAVEMDVRTRFIEKLRAQFPQWGAKLGEDRVIELALIKALGETALTHDVKIEMGKNHLPTTFVPGRNIFFLTTAAVVAYRRGLDELVAGMCETDSSGYPDCREATIKSTQVTLMLGLDRPCKIQTPLMHIDKAETWLAAERLGGQALIDLILEETHTCYRGDRSKRHPWGYGCAECPACSLRITGWLRYEAGRI
jgi:7-cyano-7-deazaguanine synthase